MGHFYSNSCRVDIVISTSTIQYQQQITLKYPAAMFVKKEKKRRQLSAVREYEMNII